MSELTYEVFGRCNNPDCDCHGGGWVYTKRKSLEDAKKIMLNLIEAEEETCPECHELLSFSLYSETFVFGDITKK